MRNSEAIRFFKEALVNHSATIQSSESSTTICRYGDTIVLSFSCVAAPIHEVLLSLQEAGDLAAALRRIVGEELPKSRQIGGIIGPY